MTTTGKSICWAITLILLAIANRIGWIADKDATAMFAVLPALWIATGGLGRCRQRKVPA